MTFSDDLYLYQDPDGRNGTTTPLEPVYEVCPDCGGEMDAMSECCGAKIDTDMMMCYDCKEHSDLAVCETCNGKGKVQKEN